MSGADAPDAPAGAGPSSSGRRPLTVTGLLLLDPGAYDPTLIDAVVVDDRGISVIRQRGEPSHLLPWDAVVAHAVEPWGGGVIPGWWVDPTRQRPDGPAPVPGGSVTALVDAPPSRRLPHVEAGALISVQTRTGTYRFVRSGGDTTELATRIGAFAVHHHGPSGTSTVTTVADRRLRRRVDRTGWARIRPVLIVVAVAFVIAAIVVILLQSAGVIHLPFLGGTASGEAVAGPGRPA